MAFVPTATGDDSDANSPSLAELRLRIQALATVETAGAGEDDSSTDRPDPDGQFAVACARTGASPVPIDGYRFEDRETAAEAAEYAIQYRALLRELDPRTPHYDPVVHEVGERYPSPTATLERTALDDVDAARSTSGDPIWTDDGRSTDHGH